MREDDNKKDEKYDANYNFHNDINDELLRYNKSETNFNKFFTQKEINEGRLFSAISYLCLFAIIPYLNDTTNRYIKFHAKQGMNLLILEMIVTVGHIFFGFGFIGGLFSLMEFILFAYSVVGFIFAITGNSKKLPYLDVISVIR